MALVQHQGRNLQQALFEYLGQQLRGIAEYRLQQLANSFADDIATGGTEVLQGMRMSLREAGSEITRYIRGTAEDFLQGVNEFGQSIAHQFSDEDNMEIELDENGNIGQEMIDVINQNDEGNAQVGNRRDREGNMTDEGNRVPPEGGERMALTAMGGNNPVSKETQISQYPNLSYGFQETHTTILPWCGWLSASHMDSTTPVQLGIRMNTPYDFVINGLTAQPAIGVIAPSKGLYKCKWDQTGKRSAVGFPEELQDLGVERPNFRDTWAQLYEWYTVLGCEYKITIDNPTIDHGQRILIGTQFDVYSDTATSIGNVMPLTNLSETLSYKNMKWDLVTGDKQAGNGGYTVITGKYKPGQAKRNINNDGDVKTWTKTVGTTIPNLKEILTINLWRGPLGLEPTSNRTCCNMQVELKWIVQYKDLRLQARYPNTITTDQDIQINLSDVPSNAGSALQVW